eukprot:7328035-Prymnesium_polylepis.1
MPTSMQSREPVLRMVSSDSTAAPRLTGSVPNRLRGSTWIPCLSASMLSRLSRTARPPDFAKYTTSPTTRVTRGILCCVAVVPERCE